MKLQCLGCAAGCLLLPFVGIPILVAGFSTLTQSAATEDSNQVSVAFPPADQLAGFATAAQTTGVPDALLMALAAQTSGMTFNPVLVSQAVGAEGSPIAFGGFQMQPDAFLAAGQRVGLPAEALTPTSDTGKGTDWGEPQGELSAADEALAAAQLLEDQGATGTAGQATLEAAVTAYLGGPPATPSASATSVPATPTPSAATASATASPSAASPTPTPEQAADTVVTEYLPIYQAWIAAGEPPMGGSAPDCRSGQCEVAATTQVFPWVPTAGFPDYYPSGQCTYWAAFNFDPFPQGTGGGSPQNLGDGGDWYSKATTLGLPTLPPSVLPPYGSAVSYLDFPGATAAGHVAVVISDDANGQGYWVSEMNALGLGVVDVAHETFPSPYLQGSVLAPQASAWAGQ
jgi:hypothetical protein